MGRQMQGMPQFSEQAGLCVHSGLRVLRDLSAASIKGYNYLFSIDSQTKFEYYRNRGINLAKEGRFAEAIPILKKIHKIRPDDVEAVYYLGRACVKSKQLEEGIRFLEKGIEQGHPNYRLSSLLGMAYIKTKQYAKAVTVFEKTIAEGVQEFDIFYRLGMAYDHLGEIDKSIAAFRQAIEQRPNEPKAYQFLGLALEQKGEHASAVKFFKKALELEESEK